MTLGADQRRRTWPQTPVAVTSRWRHKDTGRDCGLMVRLKQPGSMEDLFVVIDGVFVTFVNVVFVVFSLFSLLLSVLYSLRLPFFFLLLSCSCLFFCHDFFVSAFSLFSRSFINLSSLLSFHLRPLLEQFVDRLWERLSHCAKGRGRGGGWGGGEFRFLQFFSLLLFSFSSFGLSLFSLPSFFPFLFFNFNTLRVYTREITNYFHHLLV